MAPIQFAGWPHLGERFSPFAWRPLFGALRKNAEVYADSLGHFLAGDLALLVDGLPEVRPSNLVPPLNSALTPPKKWFTCSLSASPS